MKNNFYFNHDSNARNDEKILMLRADYGWEGYGIYWLLIEMMFEKSDTCLEHSKIKGIAVNNNVDITLLNDVIATCVEQGLFVSNDKEFYSERLRKQKELMENIREQKSKAGKKGMAKRWEKDNTVITPLYQTHNSVITNDNKIKENKRKETKILEDKEKTSKKKSDSQKIKELVAKRSFDFQSVFYDFISMRNKMRKPMTERSVVLLLNKLDRITSDEKKQIEMIETSIERGWSSVFENNGGSNGKAKFRTKAEINTNPDDAF